MFMKKILVISLLVTLINLFICPLALAKQVTLDAGTPINLIVNKTISSELNHVGERVDFDVADDVQADSQTVIKEGTKVIGTISSIDSKASMGMAGRISIILNSMKFENGKTITFYNTIERKGTDRFDPNSSGFVGTVIASIFFFPVGIYFLCSKGKETILPANSTITVFTDRDLRFDTDNL